METSTSGLERILPLRLRPCRHCLVCLLLLFALAAAAQPSPDRFPELGPAPIAPDLGKHEAAQRIRSAGALAAAGWIDTSSRETVRSLYQSVIVATNNVPIGWTGSVNGCVPGTTTQAYKDAVLQRINWFRGMAGVPAGVSLDSALGAKDREAALMMSANQALDHTPPPSWTCYTAAGAEAAGKSNICYWYGSFNDPGCVELYIRDHGANNAPVGHRRWLLYPQTDVMGTGDVGQSTVNGETYPTANAIWVIPSSSPPRPATRDDFVAWPPQGYVPYKVVPPRWSISYPGANFAGASVTMTRGALSIPVALIPVENGYGENTLAWVANNLNANDVQANWAKPQADETVHVTVSNVIAGGLTRTFTYDVIIFDPDPVAPCSYALVPPPPAFITAAGSSGVGFLVQTTSNCSWTATSPVPWITITGGATGTGPGSVSFTVASNPGPGARSTTLTAAGISYAVNQAAPAVPPPNVKPSITAVTPVAGSGLSTTFTVTANDTNGAADIDVINVLINNVLDGRLACYLAYSRPSNVLYLVNDAGTGLVPGMVLNGSGSLSNSACSISGAGTSASAGGNNVTLTLAVTFSQTSFAGHRVVYAAVGDLAAANTGWITSGTWIVPSSTPPPLVLQSYSPASGSGSSGTFTAVFRHAAGFANITNAQILINIAIDGNNACYLTYVRPANQLYLVNDGGPSGPLIGPITPNSGASPIQNSQCSITSASTSTSGTDLTVTVNLAFLGSFRGTMLAHTAAQNYVGSTPTENTGWIAGGIWVVP